MNIINITPTKTDPFANIVAAAVQFLQPEQLPHGLGQPLQLVVPDLEHPQVGHPADGGRDELQVAVYYVQVGERVDLRDAVRNPVGNIDNITNDV